MFIFLLVCCTKLMDMYSYVNKNLPTRPPKRGCGNEEKENRFAILFRDECMKRDIQLQVFKEKHKAWVQSFRNKLFDGRRFMNRNFDDDAYLICSDDEEFDADKGNNHNFVGFQQSGNEFIIILCVFFTIFYVNFFYHNLCY